jgi:motility quorum-sensing regulator/GCU-specific mRNA interferase toxin
VIYGCPKLTNNVTFCFIEKLRPHFLLQLVLHCASIPDAVLFTRVAYDRATELKMSRKDMLSVNQTLTMSDFYKSMTTYNDHQIWQDVYRPVHCGIPLYVKLTLVTSENLLVVSFKRR